MGFDIVWEEVVDEAATAAAATSVAAEEAAAEAARAAAEALLDATPLEGPAPPLHVSWQEYFPEDAFSAVQHGETLAYRATATVLSAVDSFREFDQSGFVLRGLIMVTISFALSMVAIRIFQFFGEEPRTGTGGGSEWRKKDA